MGMTADQSPEAQRCQDCPPVKQFHSPSGVQGPDKAAPPPLPLPGEPVLEGWGAMATVDERDADGRPTTSEEVAEGDGGADTDGAPPLGIELGGLDVGVGALVVVDGPAAPGARRRRR
ncbi:uncharacterized protein PG998_010139 [Apiospora kogelbergensis]|uniref:uncharacterized protein n=1 Tax=Apiospora kogelbergensis TaxID=1337665 RepID=UPI00312ECFDC